MKEEDITDDVIESRDVEEDSIYAHKFAVMQQQIDEKDAKIQELELKQKEMCEEYCPKTAIIKELEEASLKVKDIFNRLHIRDIEPWSFYKVSGDILFDLKELLEDK